MAKSTRLNLDLNAESRRRLEELQRYLDAGTLTDVVRRALAYMLTVVENDKAGGKTILRDKDGKEAIVVLF